MTDEDALELWHERSAIREFDGDTTRLRAEFLAAKDVQRILGDIPKCVADAVTESKRNG